MSGLCSWIGREFYRRGPADARCKSYVAIAAECLRHHTSRAVSCAITLVENNMADPHYYINLIVFLTTLHQSFFSLMPHWISLWVGHLILGEITSRYYVLLVQFVTLCGHVFICKELESNYENQKRQVEQACRLKVCHLYIFGNFVIVKR